MRISRGASNLKLKPVKINDWEVGDIVFGTHEDYPDFTSISNYYLITDRLNVVYYSGCGVLEGNLCATKHFYKLTQGE